jgi:hypothetical protein
MSRIGVDELLPLTCGLAAAGELLLVLLVLRFDFELVLLLRLFDVLLVEQRMVGKITRGDGVHAEPVELEFTAAADDDADGGRGLVGDDARSDGAVLRECVGVGNLVEVRVFVGRGFSIRLHRCDDGDAGLEVQRA